MFKLRQLFLNAAAGEGGEGGGNGGGESIEALKAMIANLTESVTKLEANNKALVAEKMQTKQAAEAAKKEAAIKSGDIEALEKSWGEKVLGLEGTIAQLTANIERNTSGSAAKNLAQSLAKDGLADLLLPHIAPRLRTEFKDGEASIRVLGVDGKPSAATLQDLEKEIKGNSLFAAVLKGSQASGDGGSAGGSKSLGGKTISRSAFASMTPADQSAAMLSGAKLVD